MKYPRTFHIPSSPGISSDDKVMKNNPLCNKTVVYTEKMDGENTTITKDSVYSRSLDTATHESRSWVRAFANTFQYRLPKNLKIIGENMFAKHSIHYINLESYFLGFCAIEGNTVLSWEDTINVFNEYGISCVPILGFDYYSYNAEKTVLNNLRYRIECGLSEGIVIRNTESFHVNDFKDNVCKWVRKNHVQTDQHWMYKKVEKNRLYDTRN